MDTDPKNVAQIRRARGQQLADLLRRSAARQPNKIALIFRDQKDTFSELNTAVNRAANALAQRGIVKGDRVALFSHNNRAFIVLRFAIARLGAITTPVNFMLKAEEVAYILDHSGACAVISEDGLCDVVDAALSSLGAANVQKFSIPHTGADVSADWVSSDLLTDHPDASDVWVDIASDDPIQMMYTSGTESRPKGALVTSGALYANYISCIVDGEMTADAVSLHCLPLFHCGELDCFMTPDLYLGATSILLAQADPLEIMQTVQANAITKLFCPPTVWIALLRHPEFASFDLSSLTAGYYGASIMPTAIIVELLERLPQMRLFNFYGQTEMAPAATILGPKDQMRKLGSAGQPVLNVETRIVDENDHPLPVGEVGEIVHRSPQLILGYYNDPDKTAEAFSNGWFHSGDLGRMDEDGYLFVVDRKKDMIKTGGENVASREVEEAIFHHVEVAEVAVFGLPHPTWIEAVTAIVVPKAGSSVTVDQLSAYCRDQLAGYKSPKHIEIVAELPKNASGKILKRELRLQYQAVFTDQ